MPALNGITFNVVSQWELQLHPEFRHPDSTQPTIGSPFPDNSPISEFSSKSDRILGRSSTVAVYIPSVSGARFWLRYSINEGAAATSPWFFFKLFMNGRNVTNWGVNSMTQSTGQIMRGLFDPSERWNYRGEDGVVIHKGGCEKRPFFFAREDIERSAAEEGGLIEVMVFRALDRKRKMPHENEFKSQDQWGIVMPTGGLLENPQDAKFYDFHLRDPKDRPFATFQFHYRSWDSLIASQLIPAEHPRKLLRASPSLLSLNGHPRELQSPPKAEDESQIKICVDEVEHEAENRDSSSSITSNTPWLTTVFDDKPDPGAKNPEKPTALFNVPRTSSYPRRQRPVDVPLSKFAQAVKDYTYEDDEEETNEEYKDPVKRPPRPATPGTRDTQWAGIVDRPLPDIPTRISSLNRGRFQGHSRASSATSNAVSITPSLRSYFDRDTDSPEPPFIGVASVVHVIASTFGLNDDPEKKDMGASSSKEPQVDIRSDDEAVPTAKRPVGGVFDISNITLRKHHRSSPTKQLSPIKQSPVLQSESINSPDQDSENDADASPPLMDNNTTTISISESEWMCRTPSPTRNEKVDNLWSPSAEEHSIRDSLDGSALRKKASNVGVRASEEFEDRSLIGEENGGVRMRSGNWI